MTVAIVTPWFDHLEHWPDYHQAVSAANPHELWIVDNGSSPPLDFATLRLDTNEGFCGGCNAGLHAARTDVVVFLNNDIALSDGDWLAVMLDSVEPGVLVGPRLRSDIPTLVDGRVMPYLDGWCLAGMREDLLEIGGWDTSLQEPAYFSDNLLSLEARVHGMRLREVPVGLHHKKNGSVTDVDMAIATTAANHARYIERVRELLAVPA